MITCIAVLVRLRNCGKHPPHQERRLSYSGVEARDGFRRLLVNVGLLCVIAWGGRTVHIALLNDQKPASGLCTGYRWLV